MGIIRYFIVSGIPDELNVWGVAGVIGCRCRHQKRRRRRKSRRRRRQLMATVFQSWYLLWGRRFITRFTRPKSAPEFIWQVIRFDPNYLFYFFFLISFLIFDPPNIDNKLTRSVNLDQWSPKPPFSFFKTNATRDILMVAWVAPLFRMSHHLDDRSL